MLTKPSCRTVVSTDRLTREFKRYKKEEGFAGSVRSLFRREYVVKSAVRDFCLEIGEGEFVGLIGPNGAGKTTLMKMLSGIIVPTSGSVSVLGYVPGELRNAYKKLFAVVMGQRSQLFPDLSAADTFLLLREIYEIPEDAYRRNLSYFTDLFSVEDCLNVQVRTLSLGERMKMELIAALLHDPKILFLDEPTIGLDAVAQKQIRGFLREVNRDRGTTILLTSHYMDDIRSLCGRCVVINNGGKIYDGDMETLFDRYQTHRKITVTFDGETEFVPPCEVDIVERNPYKVSFMASRFDVREILRAVMNGYEISDVSVEEEEIGSTVERIYRDAGGARS